jgi:hypothetical protein
MKQVVCPLSLDPRSSRDRGAESTFDHQCKCGHESGNGLHSEHHGQRPSQQRGDSRQPWSPAPSLRPTALAQLTPVARLAV